MKVTKTPLKPKRYRCMWTCWLRASMASSASGCGTACNVSLLPRALVFCHVRVHERVFNAAMTRSFASPWQDRACVCSQHHDKIVCTWVEQVLAIKDFHAAMVPLRESHSEEEESSLFEHDDALTQQYMAVEPVNLTLYLTIDDNHQLQAPQFLFDLDIEKAAIRLYKAQFCVLYRLAEETGRYRGCLEHWFWRPRVPPLQNPRAWFRYAAKCVRSQVHHRRSAATLGERYTFLYTRALLAQSGQGSDKDEDEMLRIEVLLTFGAWGSGARWRFVAVATAWYTFAEQAASAPTPARARTHAHAIRVRNHGLGVRG